MINSYYFTPEGTLKSGLDEDQMRAAVRSGQGLLWVDLHKPDADQTYLLDEVFGFHPLAIEDCQHVSQHPKMEDFGRYLFLVFLAPNPKFNPEDVTLPQQDPNKSPDGHVPAVEDPVKELDLFIGANYVVTYTVSHLPFFQQLQERSKRDPKRVFGRGASFLAHEILDATVDEFFSMVDKLQLEAEDAEFKLQETESLELLTGVLEFKRRILRLRRHMGDHREVIQKVLRSNHPVITHDSIPYFRDILDHLNKIETDLDVCRDIIDHAREVTLALSDVRANKVMKLLTIIFTLSMPFTVVTGWFGMNFEHLPFLKEPWGPYAATVLMFGLAGAILLGMKRYKII